MYRRFKIHIDQIKITIVTITFHSDQLRNITLPKNSKEKKDHIATLSEKILILLREYYAISKPKIWFFEGQNVREQNIEQSLQSALKQSLPKAGFLKPASFC